MTDDCAMLDSIASKLLRYLMKSAFFFLLQILLIWGWVSNLEDLNGQSVEANVDASVLLRCKRRYRVSICLYRFDT
jgi:hypothetical protein